MGSQTSNTAKVYALTAAGACSVTLTQGTQSVTWQALSAAGQTTILVPRDASISVSATDAILSPLPFKAALGTGNGSSGGAYTAAAGEPIVSVDSEGADLCNISMKHASWAFAQPNTTRCRLLPQQDNTHAFSMQLVLTPATDMTFGWLQIADGSDALLEWVGGEPSIVAGFSYIVTLVQVSPTRILANLNMPFSVLS